MLAGDRQTVRAGIKLLIDSQPDTKVVAEADDGNTAIAQIGKIWFYGRKPEDIRPILEKAPASNKPALVEIVAETSSGSSPSKKREVFRQ